MKMNRLIVAGFVASLVLAAASTNADSLKLGDKAPMTDVKMKNVGGKDVSIADVAGKNGTLVVFSCNHCPFGRSSGAVGPQ